MSNTQPPMLIVKKQARPVGKYKLLYYEKGKLVKTVRGQTLQQAYKLVGKWEDEE